MRRLVVMSNRVSIPDGKDKSASGGLAVAIHAALREYSGVWFGWSGNVVEALADGAAQQLDGAPIVNPYDMDDVVDAMQRGLNMSRDERRARWRRLMDIIERDDVFAWRDAFVRALATSGAA